MRNSPIRSVRRTLGDVLTYVPRLVFEFWDSFPDYTDLSIPQLRRPEQNLGTLRNRRYLANQRRLAEDYGK